MKYKISRLAIIRNIIWRTLIFLILNVVLNFCVKKYGLYEILQIGEIFLISIYLLLGIIGPILEFFFWSYFLFDDTIEIKYGVFYKRFICIKIDKIKYINLCEDPIQMLLNLRSVHIYTAGGRIIIPSVSKKQAIRFYNMVKRKS